MRPPPAVIFVLCHQWNPESSSLSIEQPARYATSRGFSFHSNPSAATSEIVEPASARLCHARVALAGFAKTVKELVRRQVWRCDFHWWRVWTRQGKARQSREEKRTSVGRGLGVVTADR